MTGSEGWKNSSAPTGVLASDGSFTDKVRVRWNTVNGLSQYQVYRNTTNNSKTAAVVSSWQDSAIFEDFSAELGQIYYYWVKGRVDANDPNPSFFSVSDNGYRGFIPPAGVNASDGTHFDKVAVSWGTSSGASHYRLFRNTINSPTGAEPLTPWQTALACEDTDVKIGSLYYYFVASAADDLGACQSAISTGDSGYRALAPPIKIYASKGQFVTLIGVSWEKGASEASHFRIYRSRENDPRTAQPVSDWKIGTYYDDTSAVSGLLYYYWVTEATDETGANESVFGNDGVGMPGFMRLIGDVDGNMTGRIVGCHIGPSGQRRNGSENRLEYRRGCPRRR